MSERGAAFQPLCRRQGKASWKLLLSVVNGSKAAAELTLPHTMGEVMGEINTTNAVLEGREDLTVL